MLAFCAVLPPEPTPDRPLRGCVVYRSKTGTPQWERVLVIGEYDAMQWTVLMPDKIENRDVPRTLPKAKFMLLCPPTMWGNPLVPGADRVRRADESR